MIFEVSLIFLLIIAIISFLYSSVGHGGASGYIALMTIFSFSLLEIRPTALILNIIVSGISFVLFNKYSHFRWNLFYPFAISSIPFSFIGGSIQLENNMYKVFLALLLIFSIFRIIFLSEQKPKNILKNNFVISLLIGSIIGFFSGILGGLSTFYAPPIITFLVSLNLNKENFIRTTATMYFLASIPLYSSLIYHGLGNFYDLLVSFVITVPALVGQFFGTKIRTRLSNVIFRKTILLILIIIGFSLLIKNL